MRSLGVEVISRTQMLLLRHQGHASSGVDMLPACMTCFRCRRHVSSIKAALQAMDRASGSKDMLQALRICFTHRGHAADVEVLLQASGSKLKRCIGPPAVEVMLQVSRSCCNIEVMLQA